MFDAFRDPDQEHTDAVPHDRFDKAMWDEVREESSSLDEMLTDLRREYDYVPDFMQDVFNLLAKGDPELRSPQDMKATHVPNRQIVQDMASLPELEHLRQHTVGDGFSSTAGLLAMRTELERALSRADDLREQASAAQEARDKAAQAAQDAQDSRDDQGAQDAAESAAQAAQDAMEQLQAQAEAASAGLRQQMRKGLGKAADDAQESEETARAYGISPGDLQRMNFADRVALAQRLSSDKLRQFARLIGAFRQMASAEYRRRVTDAADETVGVEFGDDLTRLTTQELINLASPELEDDFWRRYAERGLLVKRLRGKEHQGKGPIVYVGDESGTMSGAGEMWMKGLALALLDQATREKRDFYYIGFAGSGSTREFTFPHGRTNRLDVLGMAEGFLNGGTDFHAPLKKALEHVVASDKARPDVVFVTDGQAPIPPFIEEWRTTMQRLSARCYGVYVTSGSGGAPAVIAQIADNVRTVTDLTDVHQVRDIMRP